MQKSQGDSKTTGRVMIRHEREEFAPPAPGSPIHSPFETVHDWLSAVCDAAPPAKPIETYSFGVFESPDEWLLFLVGENSYQKDGYTTATRIDFKPSFMYFILPQREHLGKPREEVLDRLRQQLEAFTRSEKFDSSFLATAHSAEWNGDTFWYR